MRIRQGPGAGGRRAVFESQRQWHPGSPGSILPTPECIIPAFHKRPLPVPPKPPVRATAQHADDRWDWEICAGRAVAGFFKDLAQALGAARATPHTLHTVQNYEIGTMRTQQSK